ncbi:MAG: ribose-phosphate pyrophosphokinase-like domain-containing protein [Clostridiaceae bacterium]|nr:ribose-phosphate pyrophosphokinase-like domain-containing protein [Clostridiaceae bacterium]
MNDLKFPAGASPRNILKDDTMLDPLGPIAIISAQIEDHLAERINRQLRLRREFYAELAPEITEFTGYLRDDYRVGVDLSRFKSGEGKTVVSDTVRGHDLYILTDVLYHGKTYERYSSPVTMSPDEHYKDLTRLIVATRDSALRINVIMPYLYQGRRFRRGRRESLDCGEMLQHLFSLGIDNFITFDAPDSRVANAVPYDNFESFPTSYQCIRTILQACSDLVVDPSKMMIVSPNEVNINRSIFYASTMQLQLGIFHTRRSFDIIDGMRHEHQTLAYLGDSVEGKDILMIGDLLDNGDGLIECASYLKAQGARNVYCFTSFAQFTDGTSRMHRAWASGIIERIFSTDLSYRPPTVVSAPWYTPVPMADDIAQLINALNHDASLSQLMAPAEKIKSLIRNHKEMCQRSETTTDKRQLSFYDI